MECYPSGDLRSTASLEAILCSQRVSLAAGVTKKLNLKGVAAFGISPEASKPMLAAFVPEGKGQPGYVGLWNIQELDKSANSIPPFSRRSFFRVTICTRPRKIESEFEENAYCPVYHFRRCMLSSLWTSEHFRDDTRNLSLERSHTCKIAR